MKGTSFILAVVAVIAITVDFQAEGLPRPQDDPPFTMVDGFAFEGEVEGSLPSSTTALPRTVAPDVPVTVAPTSPPTTVASDVIQCTQNCRVTAEYNPVCGSDSNVYTNPGMLNCARNCGQNVRQAYVGPCTTNIRG